MAEQTTNFSKIYVLPSLFTAGNMFFGFLAIIKCIQAKYVVLTALESAALYKEAVWFIFLACVCDCLDGRVARWQGRESLFGKEFDSIADVVSFGVAPSLMMYFLILSPSEGYPVIRQIGWMIGFFYLLCGGIRLARFNVITHPLLPEKERLVKDNVFIGLPIPAAAGVVASMVLLMTEIDNRFLWLSSPFLMLLIGALMVSKIPYPTFKNIDGKTQIKILHFIYIIVLLLMITFYTEYALSGIFLLYVFYGLFRHIAFKFRRMSVNK